MKVHKEGQADQRFFFIKKIADLITLGIKPLIVCRNETEIIWGGLGTETQLTKCGWLSRSHYKNVRKKTGR